MPTGVERDLEKSILRAIDEHFGSRSRDMKLLMKTNFRASWAVLPKAEGMILSLRNNLTYEADAILDLARQHYRECDRLERSLA